MPAVQAPAKVLVSGANGFIAVWVVKDLLDAGYSVRGTVRSEAKGVHLLKTFKSFVDEGKFELVVVPDITAAGAFNDAVKGVDAIEHTASPFHFNADDPNELIEPAVKGTVGMLESAAGFAGPQLKRVVVTSSCAAISNPEDTGLLDENNWNETNIREIKEKGKAAGQPAKYRASKSLAEKSAWEFYTNNKSKLSWDLITINPSFVFGPMLHEVSSVEGLNTSNFLFYNNILSGKIQPKTLEGVQAEWVDVRDVSLAHVRAIQVEEAGGNRFITSFEGFIWQDWYDAVNELPEHSVELGTPGSSKSLQWTIKYNHSKADKILGMKWHSKVETAKDLVEDIKSRGWLPASV